MKREPERPQNTPSAPESRILGEEDSTVALNADAAHSRDGCCFVRCDPSGPVVQGGRGGEALHAGSLAVGADPLGDPYSSPSENHWKLLGNKLFSYEPSEGCSSDSRGISPPPSAVAQAVRAWNQVPQVVFALLPQQTLR